MAVAAPRDLCLDLIVAPHEAGPVPALAVNIFWNQISQEEWKLSFVVSLSLWIFSSHSFFSLVIKKPKSTK